MPGFELLLEAGEFVDVFAVEFLVVDLGVAFAEARVVGDVADEEVTDLVEEVVELAFRRGTAAHRDGACVRLEDASFSLGESNGEPPCRAPVDEGGELFDVEHVAVPLCFGTTSRRLLARPL